MNQQSNSVFSFDKENHIYRLNGEIIPGFSEIAKANGLIDFSDVPPALLERCREFGTNLHAAIYLFNAGTLDMTSLSPGLKPGVKAWEDFLDSTGFKVHIRFSENPICSEVYKFGCTPDNILERKGRYIVADVKSSSSVQPYMRLQTAAQTIAIKESYGIRIAERLVIQIPYDGGSAKIVEHKDRRDESYFLSCLNVYKFKKECGLWKI